MMSRKLKFLVLVASFAFLAWFLPQPLMEIGISRPYASPPVDGQKISADELNEFLNLWSRMTHGPLQKYVGQISLASGKSYPRPLVKWLEVQNWDVERFFYDEQRLHGLIGCAALQENIDSNVSLSRHDLSGLRQIINEQRQKLGGCRFDDDELELVRANLYQITEIFAGRAVMAAPAD